MIENHPYLDYYERLRHLDRPGALALVERLIDGGSDIESLYADVLMPALIHTGQEWEAGHISVAHEHYITEVTRDVIRRMGPRMWTQTNGHSPVAVACCAPGERHVVGLMMVCDVLRARGLTVHMLGEGAPAESIRDFSLESRARLLCISCALTVHLPEAMEVIQHVRSACPDIVVLAGGAAFRGSPDRAHRLGADHYAPNVRALQQAMPAIIAGLNGAASA